LSIYRRIIERRTVRRFRQEKIQRALLEKLVNAARHAPSGANLQPLKYRIVDDEKVNRIVENVKWAAYLAEHGAPKEDQNPVAFIVVLVDTEIKKSHYEWDEGAAIQNILLVADEEGIGSCWIGSVDREAVRSILNISERYIISSIIALGYKAETPVSEDENGSIKYYRDDNGTLHVPKRKLSDIII